MKLEDKVTQNILRKLFHAQDYRIEVNTLLDAMFLGFVIEFFRKIVDAKLKTSTIGSDWYKKTFLDRELSKEEIAINSGMNMKSIGNMFNTQKREVVIRESINHYEELRRYVDSLIEDGGELNIELTIKFRAVSVDLNLSETLIVINTLAVKRAEIRGGLWSTAGKQVERPLMEALCIFFEVPEKHWKSKIKPNSLREVDFYLYTFYPDRSYRCEVKLMGKGNPEGTDVIIARDSQIFIADKLGPGNITQLDARGVEWVQLRSEYGIWKFPEILDRLKVPHGNVLRGVNVDERLDAALRRIFK